MEGFWKLEIWEGCNWIRR